MKNILYFQNLNNIGGTEVYLWEMSKKYNDWDITIYYDTADPLQLKRLKKLVRCIKRKPGEKVVCDRVFFNFNTDMIDDVESTENYYCFVAHAIYQELGYTPPINHPKLNHFIGVSQYACDKLEEYARKIGRNDIKAELCYNPLTLEPKEKVLHLISAARLDDKTKGGNRTKIFIEACDRYCERTGRHYIFDIYTNPMGVSINSINVALRQPRPDIRPYIANADVLVQLSNDMETFCYSDNEALEYGVPIVTTPLTVLKELPIPEEAMLVCNWDMSNVDEVVEKMFESKLGNFKYQSPADSWDKFLAEGKSTYKEEKNTIYKVKALKTYKELEAIDNELGFIPDEGYEFEIDKERLNALLGDNEHKRVFVEVIEEIKNEEKKNEIIKENIVKEEKKPVKRKTKKVEE